MKKSVKRTIFFYLIFFAVVALAVFLPRPFRWGDIVYIDLTYSFTDPDSRMWINYGFDIRWHDPGLEPDTEPSYYLDMSIMISPFGTNDREYVVEIRNQRISPEDVEPLRRMAEENKMERWRDFEWVSDRDRDADMEVIGMSIIMNFRVNTGDLISFASWRAGHPEGFSTIFPLLMDTVIDIAKKYADNTADFNRAPSIFDVAPFLFDD